jgi:hypothetical protein
MSTDRYVELYAGREQRRAALFEKKAFHCACQRCSHPDSIQTDRPLEEWVSATAHYKPQNPWKVETLAH